MTADEAEDAVIQDIALSKLLWTNPIQFNSEIFL